MEKISSGVWVAIIAGVFIIIGAVVSSKSQVNSFTQQAMSNEPAKIQAQETNTLSVVQKEALKSKINEWKTQLADPIIIPTAGSVTIQDIELVDNSIIVQAVLSNDSHWATFTDELLKDRTIATVCPNETIKDYLAVGLDFKVHFTVQDSPQTFDISLNKNDCN